MTIDVVCGARVNEEKAGASYYYQGFYYYFCSSACKDKFAEATMAGMNP